YLIAGTLSGIAGLVVTLRLGSGSPVAGDTLLLQVIGATVIGGTSLSGGEGGIMRTVFGALLITVLVNGLDLLGVEFWDEAIAIGVVILLGSALGSWLSQRRVGEAR